MKKNIALFLVISLLILSGNLYAKNKGAELLIDNKDGQQVSGELIAVKNSSLLLLDSEGADVSINIDGISVITIVKKRQVLKGTAKGLLMGVGISIASAIVINETLVGAEYRLKGMAEIGLVGAGIGTFFGFASAVGKDKTIQIEGKPEAEIKKALEKLRKKARVPDYQ